MIPGPFRFALLMCLLPAVAACGGAPQASPSTTDTEAVSAAMDTVYERFTRAYRLGEVDSVAVLYADAPLYLPARGDIRSGRDELRQEFGFLQRVHEQGGISHIDFESIARHASGDLAYDVGYYTLRTETPDGTLGPASRGKFTTVWRRDARGRWRILIDSFSPAPPEGD
jgi:uncharacterized protein (TIGR02246 family)